MHSKLHLPVAYRSRARFPSLLEQESWVRSTPSTHVNMVLCLPLRETAATPLTQHSEQGSPTVVPVPKVLAQVGSPLKDNYPRIKRESLGTTLIQLTLAKPLPDGAARGLASLYLR